MVDMFPFAAMFFAHDPIPIVIRRIRVQRIVAAERIRFERRNKNYHLIVIIAVLFSVRRFIKRFGIAGIGDFCKRTSAEFLFEIVLNSLYCGIDLIIGINL